MLCLISENFDTRLCIDDRCYSVDAH